MRANPRCVVDIKLWMAPASGLFVDDKTAWNSLCLDGIGYCLRIRADRLMMADVALIVPAPLGYIISPLSHTPSVDGWVCVDVTLMRCSPGQTGNCLYLCRPRERSVILHPDDASIFEGRLVLRAGGDTMIYDFHATDGGPVHRFLSEEGGPVSVTGGVVGPSHVMSGADLFVRVGKPYRLSQCEMLKPLEEVVSSTSILSLEPAWGLWTRSVIQYLSSMAAGLDKVGVAGEEIHPDGLMG